MAMEFDDLLTNHLGEFGRYQKFVFFLVSLTAGVTAFTNLGIIFIGGVPEHWCSVPELEQLDLSENQLKNLSIPLEKTDGGDEVHSSCKMYDRDYENVTYTYDEFRKGDKKVDCKHGWYYNQDLYESTLVSQWDLVCDDQWLQATASSVYMAGLMVGVVVSGTFSDMLGRKKVLFVGILGTASLACASAFATSYAMFIVMRFFLASFAITCFTTGFVIVVEMVGPKWRLHTGIMIEYFWAVGYMLVPALAYFVRDWRKLQLVLGAPIFLLLLMYWAVPESARWLYGKNRHEEANTIVRHMAKKNKVELPEDFKISVKPNSKNGFIWDLFRIKALRARTVNICWNWCVNSLVYYGLSLNTSNLGGNPYINCFISGAVEVPAYIFVQLNPLCCGRRVPLSGTMILAGVALLITLVVPQELEWVSISLAMLGKFAISASFALVYVFTAELYPTQVRNVAVGSGSFFARIGGVAAPYIGQLGSVSSIIPIVIFGGSSILAGGLALLLPETKDKHLPQTLDELEQDTSPKKGQVGNGIPSVQGNTNEAFEEDIQIKTRL